MSFTSSFGSSQAGSSSSSSDSTSSYGGCELTPQARAFSTILSAFVGSVINGLTSGWLIAFITGWITWFACFRVVIGGSYMLYRSVSGTWGFTQVVDEYEMLNRATTPDPESAAQLENGIPSQNSTTNIGRPPKLSDLSATGTSEDSYHRYVYISVFGNDRSSALQQSKESTFSALWPTRSDLAIRQENARLAQQKRNELLKYYASERDLEKGLKAFIRMRKLGALPNIAPIMTLPKPLNREVTILGWVGWTYSAVYSPISQIIWLASNASTPVGLVKIVKGISVAVTALPLCLDNKVRFADSLRHKRFGGTWAYYAFNITNASSCTFQGVLCGALLIWGVGEARSHTSPFFASSFPWPVVVIYPIFSLIWAWVSFRLAPMVDGEWRRASQAHWTGYFIDVGMGAFAGIFVATPAAALYFTGKGLGGESGARDLEDFLSCAASWEKFSAIFP